MPDKKDAAVAMAEQQAREIKELKKQVCRERILGLQAQIELGQALKDKAETELTALENA